MKNKKYILVFLLFIFVACSSNTKKSGNIVQKDNYLYFKADNNISYKTDKFLISSVTNGKEYEIKNDKAYDIINKLYNPNSDSILLISRSGCFVNDFKRDGTYVNINTCRDLIGTGARSEVTSLKFNSQGKIAFLLNGGFGEKKGVYYSGILLSDNRGNEEDLIKEDKEIVDYFINDTDVYYILNEKGTLEYMKGTKVIKYNLKTKQKSILKTKLNKDEYFTSIFEYKNGLAFAKINKKGTTIVDDKGKILLTTKKLITFSSPFYEINGDKYASIYYGDTVDSSNDALLKIDNKKISIVPLNKKCVSSEPFLNVDGVYCETNDETVILDKLNNVVREISFKDNREKGYGIGYGFYKIK